MPLTFVDRISFVYPSGQQNLASNFHAEGGRDYFFASRGKIFAYNQPTGITAARAVSANDITLRNHPSASSDRIWGFTQTEAGNWITLTRETGTGYIGTLRSFQADGTAIRTRRVPDVVTGINNVATKFRAPKVVVEVDGSIYVRVVRSIAGNMRWLRFSSDLVVQDDDIVVNSANPSTVSDAASNGYLNTLILQNNQNRVYGIQQHAGVIIPDLQTDLDSRNTNALGAAVTDDILHVADNGWIYRYSGVPTRPASTGTSKGGGFFAMYAFSTFSGRDFRRRRF